MKKFLFLFLSCLLIFSGGCRTLREKFIRQKPRKEAPVYVAFKEYPQKPTRQIYIDYYLYVRGWLDELAKALEKGISHKRQSYAASEALMNMDQIISFFNQEGKDAISSLHSELQAVKAEIERIPNLSRLRRDLLIRKTQSIRREFDSYTYSNVEEWLD